MSFFNNPKNFVEPNHISTHMGYVPVQYANAPIHSKSLRRRYIDHMVEWLNEDVEENESPLYRKRTRVKRKHIVFSFIDDIINTLHSNEFDIEDMDQFKEDIVYYIYRLTSLK